MRCGFNLREEEGEKRAEKSKPWPSENRGRQGLKLDEAKKKASFDETGSLLNKAETLRELQKSD